MSDLTDWKAVADEMTAYALGLGGDAMAERERSIEANRRAQNEPFSVKEFRESGLLWFINNALLWPLGIALVVSIDSKGVEGPPGSYDSHLRLSQWAFPDGHRETIETTWTDEEIAAEPGGKHPWQRLLEWLPDRIRSMSEPEAKAALQRLASVGIVEGARPDKPREVWTQDGLEYEISDASRETSPVDIGPVDPGDEQG